MTPRKPLSELEADEFVCVRCGAVAVEHPMDGMGECPACAEAATHNGSRRDADGARKAAA